MEMNVKNRYELFQVRANLGTLLESPLRYAGLVLSVILVKPNQKVSDRAEKRRESSNGGESDTCPLCGRLFGEHAFAAGNGSHRSMTICPQATRGRVTAPRVKRGGGEPRLSPQSS